MSEDLKHIETELICLRRQISRLLDVVQQKKGL